MCMPPPVFCRLFLFGGSSEQRSIEHRADSKQQEASSKEPTQTGIKGGMSKGGVRIRNSHTLAMLKPETETERGGETRIRRNVLGWPLLLLVARLCTPIISV
jgi:hypothetical protein